MKSKGCLLVAVMAMFSAGPTEVWAQDMNSCASDSNFVGDPCHKRALEEYESVLETDARFLSPDTLNFGPEINIPECRDFLDFLVKKNQPSTTPPHFDLLLEVYCSMSTLNKYSYPAPIRDGSVCPDVTDDPDPLPCKGHLPLGDKQKQAVLKLAASIGRIELKVSDRTPANQLPSGEPKVTHYLWATGFLVAPDVVATTCHALESLLVEKGGIWKLKKDNGQDLIIDFEEDTTDYSDTQAYDNDREFEIKEVLGYSAQRGLDVILLQVSKTSILGHESLPPMLSLFPGLIKLEQADGRQEDKSKRGLPIVLVGYPDLYHPVDPRTMSRSAYGFYRDTEYAKFAAVGKVATVNQCSKSDIKLLHDAPTMVGESGSALFIKSDLNPDNLPSVIGLHTCCALPSREYNTPPKPRMPCAELENTYENQAISSWSILNDPDLCTVLHDHGVTVTCPHSGKEASSK